jgi:hypothetical protein
MSPRPPYLTHFLCIPLRTPSFLAKVKAFNDLLPPEIPRHAIRSVNSHHLSLGMMYLPKPEDIVSTLDLLYSCRSDVLAILQGRKLSAHFKGIMSAPIPSLKEKMHFVSVVPELGDGRLQSLCSNNPLFNAYKVY